MARSNADEPLAQERILHALLILLAADRDSQLDNAAPERSELLLSEAGFSNAEIGRLLARNPEAVRSAVRRKASKKKARK